MCKPICDGIILYNTPISYAFTRRYTKTLFLSQCLLFFIDLMNFPIYKVQQNSYIPSTFKHSCG